MNNYQPRNNWQPSNKWQQPSNSEQSNNRLRSGNWQQKPEPMDTTSANARSPQQGFHSQPWKQLQPPNGNFAQSQRTQRHNRMEATTKEDDNCSTISNVSKLKYQKSIIKNLN